VADELDQHSLQVPLSEDQQMVEQLSTHGPHPALGDRVRLRRPIGQPDDLDALTSEDVVERAGELGVTVAEQEPGARLAVLQLPGQVASLLGHPLAGRVEGAAGEVDAAAGELDEEEDVEPGQPDGVDGEEVGGQDLVGMLADELVPGALAAAWSREQAVAAEDLADGEVRAAMAEAEEFALDAAVAPARVFAGEAEDELVEFGRSRALPTRAPAVGGPLATDEVTVPPEQGLGAGQEGEPGGPGEDAADGCEEDAIGGLPAWTADLAFEDAELVAEGEDLGAEPGIGMVADDQDLEEEADDGVGEGAEHDPRASQRCRIWRNGRIAASWRSGVNGTRGATN
jgi:hypothetical protein